MSPFILLLSLAILGAAIAAYLIWKRKKKEHPVCIIGEDCNVVLESKYNKLFVVHNDVMGLLYYFAMIAIVIMLRYDIEILSPDLLYFGLKAFAAVGAMMGVLLMFLQWKVLKSWCFWCIISNLNTWIIALVVFGIL